MTYYASTIQAAIDSMAAPSSIIQSIRSLRKRPENCLGLLTRALSKEEIAVMEGRGCRADDWTTVQVAEDFDPFRVRRSHFVGNCVLGRFRGECEVQPGISLPSGVYDCTLIDAQVGNDCLLENVRFCARCIVEHGAVLFDIGSLTADEELYFGCNQWVHVGPETGGRAVPLWYGINANTAFAIATSLQDTAAQASLKEAHESYLQQVASDRCWVGRGSVVRHTTRISNAYLGAGCLIDQAVELRDVAILCDADHPTRVTSGAVSQSLLGPGVSIGCGSIVRHAVLVEHCSIDANAVVEHSIIAANADIAKGEITASIVGPYTGLHHQSLLIGALWPEGKGNIAYGAMVGSNHTGRAPDQEIWPGEGTFFGLGSNIKFPSDFSKSPYLVIASGVSTLAQRVSYPFSLIATPIEALAEEHQVPRAFNEISPAWGLYANAYAIVRSELKYLNRDRTGRLEIPHQVLRPEIMGMVEDALKRLRSVENGEPIAEDTIYQQDQLPGLGKNFLRERIRLKAIEAYETVLKRYSLRVLLAAQEQHEQLPGSIEIAERLADTLMPGLDLAQRLQALIDIEVANVEIVKRAKVSDDARGLTIIPGYDDCHCPVSEDKVVLAAQHRLERTKDRIAQIVGAELPRSGLTT